MRERAKTIVWRSARMKARAIRSTSPYVLPRMPRCASTTGGLRHHASRAGGCPGVVDDRDRPAREGLGQDARPSDGGGAEDQLRVAAVVRAEAEEAPQDVGHMAAEDATVEVGLVDHDVAQLFEELEPLRVVRQDGRVEHVGVGQHDLAGGADRGAHGGRGIAVVDSGARPSSAAAASSSRATSWSWLRALVGKR